MRRDPSMPLAVLVLAVACARYEYRRGQCPPAPPSRSSVVIEPAVGPQDAIAGVVQTTDSATAVAGAVLHLEPIAREVMSDSLGHFRFDALAPGTYTLAAQRIGFMPGTAAVSIRSERGAWVRVLLEQRRIEFDGCGYALQRARKPWWKFW